MVQRSLSAVSSALRSSAPRTRAPHESSGADPPLGLLSPSEFDRTGLPPNKLAASSPGVLAPSALAAPEARFPRAYHTRHLPSLGFCTLLTVSFFQSLPALFHAGNALGVLPSGLFPLTEPSDPLGSGAFLALVPAKSHWSQCSSDRFVAFKALLPVRIRHLRKQGELPVEGRCPPGLLPSRDFPLDAARCLRTGSPRELHPRPVIPEPVRHFMTSAALQGVDSIEVGLSLSRLPPLLGFLHLLSKPPVR